jgi:hypothetical protein
MFGNCYGSCDFDALCYRLDSGILMLAAEVHFTRIGTVKFIWMYVMSTKDNFREAQLKASLHDLYFYELISIIIVTLFYFCGECITYAQILHI